MKKTGKRMLQMVVLDYRSTRQEKKKKTNEKVVKDGMKEGV